MRYRHGIWATAFSLLLCSLAGSIVEAVGNISADATGTSYLTGVCIPVPIIARAQHAASEGLTQQLAEFIGEVA